MKNIHRILGLAAAISLTLPACNNMLEPTPYGQQTIDASFTSFGGTLNAVNGMYNPLIGGNLYRGNNALLYVDYASDDVMGGESRLTSSFRPTISSPLTCGTTFTASSTGPM